MRDMEELRPIDADDGDGPLLPMFQAFRDELNDHYDRRERVYKTSRDITALSKKIIFSLQRVRQLNQPLPDNIAKDIASRLATVDGMFLSLSEDLCGMRSWRYQRQISPGIQEYVEAISFQRYLQSQALISLEEASNLIVGGVQLTEDDYIMGTFDLVGELMRFGITAMATSGTLPGEQIAGTAGGSGIDIANQQKIGGPNILTDLRSLRTYFEKLDAASNTPGRGGYLARDLVKKTEVMKKCVEKVECAVYGMIIRGQERPKGWVPDFTDTAIRGLGHDIIAD
ncbi:MAG: hypothetical protein M1839_006980 [Geoglossum umbratile]|nr:MAG: hypothetical protein M1839_006980 [Geoglossum umbratile]